LPILAGIRVGNPITMKYKAFLFDLNGTMINDLSYHVNAWYRILNELGANISKERAKAECYGKNQELLERVLPGRFSEEEKNKISLEKERQYQKEFSPNLKLINGLELFLKKSKKAGTGMAIGSAAIQSNIDFVLDGLGIRKYFDAIVSADDVMLSKPDPETYIACADKLGMAARDCLVFEDAPQGAESARNAGMDCVIITTSYKREKFRNYNNIIHFIEDYDNFTIS
jgi:HAD superfamily hydrolase (TIGR01509 family)